MRPYLAFLLLACVANLSAAPLSKVVADFGQYDYGQSRSAILELQAITNSADATKRAEIEAGLLTLLQDAKTPRGAKDEACRLLASIGTSQSIPVLEKLTNSPAEGFLATYALMDFPGAEAEAALLRALDKAPPSVQAEIIGALGRRQVKDSVTALAEIARTGKENAPAAMTALGAIGTPEAIKALNSLPAQTGGLELGWAKVYACHRLAASSPDQAALAFETLEPLLASPVASLRWGAAEGLVQGDSQKAVALLLPLLTSQDSRFRLDLAQLLARRTEANFSDVFPKLTPDTQAVILLALAERSKAEPLVSVALASPDEAVRLAGMEAAGSSLGAGAVPLLLPFLSKSEGGEAARAAAVLGRIRGDDVDQALRTALATSPDSTKIALLRILANRLDHPALPLVLAASAEENPQVREAAFQVIGLLAEAGDIPAVMETQANIKTPADQAAWGKAILILAQGTSQPDLVVKALTQAIPKASEKAQPAILLALANTNSPAALAPFQEALQNPDLEKRKEALRILTAVRIAPSLAILLNVAKNGKDPTERILAVRGYLDGLRVQTDLAPKVMASAYEDLWQIAERPEEKAAIIATLKTMKGGAFRQSVQKLSAQGSKASPPQKS